MSDKHQLEQYLALAEEAEHHAATGVDQYAREQWQRIAKSYREIAQGMVVGTADAAPGDVSEQPSHVPASQAPLQAKPDAADELQSVWQRIKAFLRRGAT